MYYIIENKEQIDYLKENFQEKCFINIITLNDRYHNKLTSPCLVYFKPINNKGYIICVNHSESFSIEFNEITNLLSKYKEIYLLDKKKHLYFLPSSLNLIDLNFDKLEADNTVFDISNCDTPVHSHFYRTHGDKEDVNRLIPISKHFEKQENIFNVVKDIGFNDLQNEYNNKFTSNFFQIENNGVMLNMSKFKENFHPLDPKYSIKDNKIYSNYNLYNLTTRPTNNFNNVNFSALLKDGNTRASFIPEKNMFVEFDFDAYHPRIIANLVGINFSSKPAHIQLASMYYNTPNPTQDQIDFAKKTTFKQLYGGIDDKYKHIKFFNQTQKFIDSEWVKYKEGKTKLFGGRKLNISDNMNESKLLNYIIQSYETYHNTTLLSKILKYLEDKNSKIILYNYDSFLLDVDKNEGSGLLKDIKNILEEQFPVKISYGKNYKEMVKL